MARLPQFQVAIYNLLLLSSILAYGFRPAAAYLPLPKWRRPSIRPSLLDLLNFLRQQITARAFPSEPQFIVDSQGKKTGVVINLEKHGRLWEDIYDNWLAEKRKHEPRNSFRSARSRLRGRGKVGW